ncbi:4-hydroxybenzoate 3-monooxygenase [Kutzneria buriramensis]|uniref:p-hydroxybenzoate 3-monooxygenase n=1 Tax=Kutzneria buriramensis TaxID=1045776 RepID=A0A3E0GYP4_9PSEU|nr:4-hydroxybenzoate 3-monooxygenase [Kutzneria buriramensis]REH32659.1 p-hydroxybenzoate 3-monooxygenase [Kutzneria buriramensis]
MADRATVLIVGAGPAGLVLGNLLRANGIDTLILERGSRERVQTRARAGFLGANSARVLTEHGLAAGMLRSGQSHDTCAFRDAEGEFELNYGELGRGEVHTVYPQQHLVTDLIAEYLHRGGRIRFDVTVTEIDAATATVRHNGGESRGRFVVGCDGSNGVSRRALPADLATRHARDHGIAWLAVLTEAPQSMTAVTYALHDNGFAGHMARSPQVTRYYLQVCADDDPAAWPDERIWSELAIRMRVDRFGPLREGPVTERRMVRLRSDVVDPMQHGRLFLAGDAASLISPSAAKGANLAIMQAEVLARALTDAVTREDEAALRAYSRTCLPRIWRAQEFSHWMITLLHGPAAAEPDAGFQRVLRRARLSSLRDSRSHQDFFAENYVGI